MEYLSRNGVIYEYQKKFDGLRNKNPLPFDFYIPDSNICIEYDGQQHFEPIDAFGGLESFNKLKDNDAKKDEFCEIRGIELIRISYLNFDLIDSILKLSLHLNNL
jgi:very-short-patch-repair endonuclease